MGDFVWTYGSPGAMTAVNQHLARRFEDERDLGTDGLQGARVFVAPPG